MDCELIAKLTPPLSIPLGEVQLHLLKSFGKKPTAQKTEMHAWDIKMHALKSKFKSI